MRVPEKVIFLDFDGVLNPSMHKHFLRDRYKTSGYKIKSKDEHGYFFDPYTVSNLKWIVEETNACIVVASSWRLHVDIHKLWNDRNLPGTVIGKTPTLSTQTNRDRKMDNAFHLRGKEVDMWLDINTFKGKFVIIDDHPEIFDEHHMKYLIACDKHFGLTARDAEKAIEILSNLTPTRV